MPAPVKILTNSLLGWSAVIFPVGTYGGLIYAGHHWLFTWKGSMQLDHGVVTHDHAPQWLAAVVAPAAVPLVFWAMYQFGKFLREEIIWTK